MRKIDVGVETDRVHNVAESVISEGLEKCFEKPNELGDLPSALENVWKTLDPGVGRGRRRLDGQAVVKPFRGFIGKNIAKRPRVQKIFPINTRVGEDGRLREGICVHVEKGESCPYGVVEMHGISRK